MALYNIISPELLVSGQPEDISVVLTNLQAIQTVLNGGIDNSNISPTGAIDLTTGRAVAGYTAFTPVFSGSSGGGALGNATSSCWYVRIGKLVHYVGNVVWGSTTSAGSGTFQVSLPFSTPSISGFGLTYASDASSGFVHLAMAFGAGANFNIQWPTAGFQPTAGLGVYSATQPWTWAVNDGLRWNFVYQST